MRWRHLSSAVLFACIFAASCAVLAPASVLGLLLERASGGRLLLAESQGTVWNGSGIVVLKSEERFVSLGGYGWHAHPLKIFAGQLSFVVQQGEDARPLTMSISPWQGEMHLMGLHAALPVQVLEMASPQLRPYRLGGELDLEGSDLKLSSHGMEGRLLMRWERAGSGVSDIYPLGNYQLALEGAGKMINVQLSTQSGQLLLAGRGQLEPGRGLTFNGTAQAGQGGQLEGLSELLHHIGPETSPGVFVLALMPQTSDS